jgi:hypothetical protein
MRRRILGLAVIALGFLALTPTVARAQSAIAGTVKDESGSILPGVTVEAASDVLIEKTRSAVTDGEGRFQIIDLRPGTYVITFTLTGFQTVKREGVNLPAEFTATINADMKVGSLQETITVTGDAPTVDVQSAAHTQRMDRDIMDSLPTARTIQSIGQLVVGVNLSLPDVGGSRSIMQTYMSVHGQSAANNTVLVDGIQLNGLEADGLVQSYYNDAMIQEMSYQTSGIGAETSTGGVRLNMIPKDGGNRFSGSATGSYRPQKWQSTNLTDRVAVAGVIYPNSTNVTDGSFSFAGPVMKDKLWFMTSARDLRTTNGVLNTYKTPPGQTNLYCIQEGRAGRATCPQGDDFNELWDVLVRTTYQISQRNKISLMYDRIDKYRAHDMQSNYDPDTAANVWHSPNYASGTVKYTSTVSSRLLVEAGYGLNNEYRNVDYQPGIEQPRWSQQWYTTVSQATAAAALGLVRQAAPNINQQWPKRSSYMASASYVTGSHHVKAGLSGTWGKFYHTTDANGDLQALFSDSNFTVPTQVVVRNTPLQAQEKLNSDIGLYIQDTWTLKRLTLNGGLRWSHLNASVTALSSPSGRFVPARSMTADIPDLPNWNSFAPRVQAVYDLFGNARTAVKASFNRYDLPRTTGIAATYNPLTAKTAAINWTDVNGDGIPQGQRFNPDGSLAPACSYPSVGCELDLANLPSNFGQLSDTGTYGTFPRPYIFETGLEVQHELVKRLSVTGTWFRGSYHNMTTSYNASLTNADFTPVQIFNPIDGTPMTVYNRNSATAPATNTVTILDPDYKRIYSSFSAEFRLRFAGAGVLFGGLSWEKEVTKNCTAARLSDPNGNLALLVPSVRYCDLTSNDVANGGVPDNLAVPYTKNLRLSGSYPLPWWGIQASATLQSNGFLQSASYQITGGTTAASTRYPDGTSAFKAAGVAVPACPTQNGCVPGGFVLQTALRQGTITVPLFPASQPWERLTQVDFKLAKNFKVGRATVSPQFEAFNLNNSDKVITVASTAYANSGGTYLVPNSMVQGRLFGASVQVKW